VAIKVGGEASVCEGGVGAGMSGGVVAEDEDELALEPVPDPVDEDEDELELLDDDVEVDVVVVDAAGALTAYILK
jgi:hypothetical protein